MQKTWRTSQASYNLGLSRALPGRVSRSDTIHGESRRRQASPQTALLAAVRQPPGRVGSAPAHAILDHQAAVLHDLDALARESLGELVVPDPRLQPHGPGSRGQDVVQVRRQVLRPAEHVDE